MAEYIVQIDHPELCLEYGGTNYTDRLERIVRCRDCKHWKISVGASKQDCWAIGEPFRTEPDGFCAWGEPKVVE